MTNTVETLDEQTEEARQLLLRLFSKSVLKQQKWRQLQHVLGTTEGLSCLDLGADNGVISYLLRNHGGDWHSADMSEEAVASIRLMVGDRVALFDGERLPYDDKSFDVVVVIDMLEHVRDDKLFVLELARVCKPGARLIINVPNRFEWSLLKKLRNRLGQTDEAHGHLRPGYNAEELLNLVCSNFALEYQYDYSKFVTELIDTMLIAGYATLSGKKGYALEDGETQSKGLVITADKLAKFKRNFRIYSGIYPVVYAGSQLDKALAFAPGFMRLGVFRAKAS